MSLIVIWLTLAGTFAASYCDVRSRRIPNVITGSLALTAVIVHAFFGLWPLLQCLGVMAALTVGGYLVYSRGGIGAGDIKLAIAGSGMLSYPLCVPFLLYTGISGGFIALLFLLARASARTTLSRSIFMTLAGAPGIATDKREKLPYAVAFALGAVLLALSQSFAPFLRISI
jgi:Flp pilus assembly protein protease CpaA